jgi:hypothetical protein
MGSLRRLLNGAAARRGVLHVLHAGLAGGRQLPGPAWPQVRGTGTPAGHIACPAWPGRRSRSVSRPRPARSGQLARPPGSTRRSGPAQRPGTRRPPDLRQPARRRGKASERDDDRDRDGRGQGDRGRGDGARRGGWHPCEILGHAQPGRRGTAGGQVTGGRNGHPWPAICAAGAARMPGAPAVPGHGPGRAFDRDRAGRGREPEGGLDIPRF